MNFKVLKPIKIASIYYKAGESLTLSSETDRNFLKELLDSKILERATVVRVATLTGDPVKDEKIKEEIRKEVAGTGAGTGAPANSQAQPKAEG
ncbi:hypothetical protein [Helicobacter sp. 11S02629-2]|uniref:hypothetical protein n=1 Tax=Helicobacter sp. 11S02629-2 TaxID=1476195 RepID=UPI000BA669EE|nr:hypothetical protein [Helicobacter sp. 11S02629-2]PAF44180.1 hypothetical protein BKH40_06175 [Helicobacter sp. 11S02629-2]